MKRFLLFFTVFVLGGATLFGQTILVRGTVTDQNSGQTLPGVTVLEKGTSNGVATDPNGRYEIRVRPEAVLVFSFIGMQAQEVAVEGRTTINVALAPDVFSLDAVVIVGYGTALKRELTGSISKVETEGIAQMPSHTFETAIQGRASGVFVEQASGKLGESIKMRIRGSSSISADNQPLYVIDGVPITTQNQGQEFNQPTSPLADLSMTDIESIQILKDASAAAIYGSRASNGVVIINTKRGQTGVTRFNVNYSSGLSEPSRLMEWLNAQQYFELLDEAMDNVLYDGLVWGWLPKEEIWRRYGRWNGVMEYDEDWQAEAFQKGSFNRISFNGSGGMGNTTFYAGISYDDHTGILRGNNMNKFNARLNLDQKASDRFSFGMQMSLNRNELERVENDNAFATPLQLVAQSPLTPIIDPATGEYNTNTVYYNGLISIRDTYNNTTVFRTLANAYGAYNILDGLTFRSEFGTDLLDQREKNFWGRNTIGAGPAGEAQNRSVRVLNYNWENYFNFDKALDLHVVNVVAGMSYQESNTVGNNIEGRGFPTDDFQNIASAAEASSFSSWEYGHSFLSFFSRVNYKFMDKYLLSLSGRVDGSSRFGIDNRFGFFPSVSAGWILSEENFLRGLSDPLSFLKVRASYGITGNSGIPDYAHLALFGGVNYAGRNGIEPIQLQSRALGWERTSQFNVGADFGLFNDRLTFEVDYYYKYTTDLLLYRTLPSTSGYTGVWSNFGTLENKGLEFALRSNNLTGRFSWTTDFNISFNRNKILDVGGEEITPNSLSYVMEGQPLGVFKMRKYAGVDPDNGDALFYLNADSQETTNDYNLAESQVVGSPNPDFVGGLSNYMAYGGFDLNVLMSFVYGNMIYRGGGIYQSANGDWFDNQTVDQMNRWQNPGDITEVPQARLGEGNGTQESDRYLTDGSYLRLRNIELGYTLPQNVLRSIRLSGMRIYLSVQNLYTFTKYEGWDPEVNFLGTNRSTQNQNIIQGIDFYTAPQARTYSVGINFTF